MLTSDPERRASIHHDERAPSDPRRPIRREKVYGKLRPIALSPFCRKRA